MSTCFLLSFCNSDNRENELFSSIITSIAITTPPDKTQYNEGETFDAASFEIFIVLAYASIPPRAKILPFISIVPEEFVFENIPSEKFDVKCDGIITQKKASF